MIASIYDSISVRIHEGRRLIYFGIVGSDVRDNSEAFFYMILSRLYSKDWSRFFLEIAGIKSFPRVKRKL